MYKASVKEFQKAVYAKTRDWRSDLGQTFIPNNPTAIRIATLIKEEADELIEALLSGTEEEVRKEMCDLLYVAMGPAVIYELPVDNDFELVHENNMLKIKTGIIRKVDGKFMKHPNHPKVVF